MHTRLAALRPVAPVPHTPDVLGESGKAPLRLVRPLLGVQRDEIVAYLQRHDLAWVEDETNADTRFVRNHLRHMVLPALASVNPNIIGTLARSAELLAAEAERAAAADAAVDQLLVEPPVAARVVLDLASWQRLFPWPPAAVRCAWPWIAWQLTAASSASNRSSRSSTCRRAEAAAPIYCRRVLPGV